MKSAGKARNNGLYRHIRTSKEIIRNLLNDYSKSMKTKIVTDHCRKCGNERRMYGQKDSPDLQSHSYPKL